MEGAAAWRAATSQGNRGFEGLGLGSYRDREIRVLVSGSEILRIVEKVSDSVVYKNIWISEAEEQQLTAYVGSLTRQLPVKSRNKDPRNMAGHIADNYLKDGKKTKNVIKRE